MVDINGLDEVGESSENSYLFTAFEHVLWLVSRSLLALALLGIAWAVKIPVDNLLKRTAQADLAKIRQDRAVAEIEEMQTLTQRSLRAQRAYADLAKMKLNTGSDHYEQRLGRASRRARQSHEALAERFLTRKEDVPTEYTDVVFTLIEELQSGLEEFPTTGTPTSTLSDVTFQARIELSRSLLRKLRTLEGIQRKRLLGGE